MNHPYRRRVKFFALSLLGLAISFAARPVWAENMEFSRQWRFGYENHYLHRPVLTALENNYSFRSNLFLDWPCAEDTHYLIGALFSPFTHGPAFNLYFDESFFSYSVGVKQRLGSQCQVLIRHHRWLVLQNAAPAILRREVVLNELQLVQRLDENWNWGGKLSHLAYYNPYQGSDHLDQWLRGPLLGWEGQIVGPFYLSVQLAYLSGYLNSYFSVQIR